MTDQNNTTPKDKEQNGHHSDEKEDIQSLDETVAKDKDVRDAVEEDWDDEVDDTFPASDPVAKY
jgi:hypothetical protein